MHKNLKKLYDNNLIVYDIDAAPGELTSKLIGLLISVYRDNRKLLNVPENANLTRFLVPRKVFFDNIGEIKVMAGLGIKIQYYTEDYGKQWKEISYYPYGDTNLVIGWDEKNQQGLAGSC